jgi:hypothetical protein
LPPPPDWSQYLGAVTNYIEPLPWVPSLTPKSYYQARHVEGTIEDPPENEDGLDYKQMEAELTEEEVIYMPWSPLRRRSAPSGLALRTPSSAHSRRPHRRCRLHR